MLVFFISETNHQWFIWFILLTYLKKLKYSFIQDLTVQNMQIYKVFGILFFLEDIYYFTKQIFI